MNFEFSSSLLSPALREALEKEQIQCLHILPQYEQKAQEIRTRLNHIQALLGKALPIVELTTATAPIAAVTSQPVTSEPKLRKSPSPEFKSDASPRSRRGVRTSNIPFRAPYAGHTMLESIGMVLRAQPGEAVSIDDVVEALYGSLGDEDYKVAKDRVTKSLSKGKQDKLWSRVPNLMGCYTFDK